MTSFADFARWDVIMEGFLLIGFAFAIIQMAKRFRAPAMHVYAISTSYGIFVAGAILETYGRLGSAASWRLWFYQAAVKFGLFAMLVMHRHYSYSARVRRHDAKSDKIAGDLLRSEEARSVAETNIASTQGRS